MRTLAQALAPALDRLRAGDEAIIDDQVTITGIASPTGSEADRGRWMAGALTRRGVRDVHVDAAGNVVGAAGPATDAAPLVLCAHLDTVFDGPGPITVRREGDRLEAPGISDNARGLATMLAVAGAVAAGDVPLARPVLFAATTGEEGRGNLRGARHLFDTAARGAHAAIALDGPGDERVVHTALGSRRYHVSFRGPGGHSWGAYGSPNAVHAAAAFVMSLSALARSAPPRAAITASRIAGGEVINAIPADAWVEVDLRSASSDELDRLDREVRLAAAVATEAENASRRTDAPPLCSLVSMLGDRPAGEVPVKEPLVVAAMAATRHIGREPALALASTDANIPISLGIPAIAIGGGGAGGDTHTTAEWFENREGSLGIARAMLIVAAMAR